MALSVLSCFCGSSVDLICFFIFLYSLPDSSQIKRSTKQRYLTYQRCKDPVHPCITVKFKEIGPMLCFPLDERTQGCKFLYFLGTWDKEMPPSQELFRFRRYTNSSFCLLKLAAKISTWVTRQLAHHCAQRSWMDEKEACLKPGSKA